MAKVFEVAFLLLAGLMAVSAQADCPSIISRNAWGARTPRFVSILPIRPAPTVIIHNTKTSSCTNIVNCSPIIRDIQFFHMASTPKWGSQWGDISYHFLIGGGQIYEGRGWGRRGENVGDFTNQAINIGLIGPFLSNSPTETDLELIDSLIACGLSQRALAQNVQVIAQCQVIPFVSCEESTILGWVSEHPRFNANPRVV